jgi:hypothetical protein
MTVARASKQEPKVYARRYWLVDLCCSARNSNINKTMCYEHLAAIQQDLAAPTAIL